YFNPESLRLQRWKIAIRGESLSAKAMLRTLNSRVEIAKFAFHRNLRLFSTTAKRNAEKESVFDEDDEKTQKTKSELNELKDRDVHWEYHQKEFGNVYDKKPIKVLCREGKVYMWCACGWSKTQPFCDGTHKIPHYKITLKPVPFKCKETKEYWFCNCLIGCDNEECPQCIVALRLYRVQRK
ncbi:CDGSH iron-sulfur domain-containing protein 3: mitochondrial-like protein, partial [Dinothrombium tinctorium]